jgi:trk system potassium uptake protein TrkA
MRIIIVGAGEVGKHLAKRLARENNNITLLDEEQHKLKDLEQFDFLTKMGQPTSVLALRDVGVDGVDLFIAVTPCESVNMTACMIASNLGAKKTLARVDNYEYMLPKNKDFFAKLGVDYLIYPEVLAAQEIAESLKKNWMRQYLSFKDGEMVLLSVKVRKNAPILNKKFISGYFNHDKYRIVAIKRNSETILPCGSDEILENDVVYFITTDENIDFVRKQAGKEDFKIKDVMIVGGTRIAQKIVQTLSSNFNVKIIEADRDACIALSNKLPNTLIINSDGRDIDVLENESIGSMDAFVAVMPSSEANLLTCMAAKRYGIKKTIAEMENLDYIALAETMDIGTIINKKSITASYIHQVTLNFDVLQVCTLPAIDAEVIEIIASDGSKITKNMVKNLRLPANVNIGGIIRKGVGAVVNGDTQILPNDHVIVFCKAEATQKLGRLFK